MNDRQILRELVRRYAQAAQEDCNAQRLALHKAVNDLHPIRPVVLINEIPWNELDFDGSLTLHCQDPYFRSVEQTLRRTLFQWKYFPADMTITPFLPVQKVIHSTGIGVEIHEEIRATDETNHIVSHKYESQFATEQDLEKLHEPVITYDQEATWNTFVKLSEAVGDLIPVQIVGEATGYDLGCKNWDIIANFMTVDDLLYGMIDEPEFMHKLAGKLTDIFLSTVRQYEELNLIDPFPQYLHCTGASSDDLKKEPLDMEHVRAKNVWGRGLAQILSTVSPEMHDEFDITYMKRAMEPFGLVYYGCCEPLDRKIDILRQLPNLRKISISPWADAARSAQAIGRDYVASVKPNPANVAAGRLDKAVIQQELSGILTACRTHETPCELVLKDISTASHCLENLIEWEQIAMRLVQE